MGEVRLPVLTISLKSVVKGNNKTEHYHIMFFTSKVQDKSWRNLKQTPRRKTSIKYILNHFFFSLVQVSNCIKAFCFNFFRAYWAFKVKPRNCYEFKSCSYFQDRNKKARISMCLEPRTKRRSVNMFLPQQNAKVSTLVLKLPNPRS